MDRERARQGTGILALVVTLGCGGEEPAPQPAIVVLDDAGATVALEAPAWRIVSLVPSVTDALVALGAADRLVGRTRYDTAPELAALPSVGGGLDPSVEALLELRPDLVFGWTSASHRGLKARLAAVGIPLYAAGIEDTTAVYRTFERLGALVGRRGAAEGLAAALRDSLAAVAADTAAGPRPAVFFALPGDPPRTAGPETFVTQLVGVAGGRPALPGLDGDWPLVALEAVVAADPDVIVVPMEGGDAAAHASLADRRGWGDLPAVRAGRVVAVPPDLFVRPGPDLGRAARALQAALARARGRAP